MNKGKNNIYHNIGIDKSDEIKKIIMKQKQKNEHINRITTTSYKMFDSNINDDIPTLKETKEAFQKALKEGEKHINKESDAIHSLAENWVRNQPYKNIWFDDAIYDAFISGAIQDEKDSH